MPVGIWPGLAALGGANRRAMNLCIRPGNAPRSAMKALVGADATGIADQAGVVPTATAPVPLAIPYSTPSWIPPAFPPARR